jgi:F0F1-type ATP synthase delta subunit
MIQKDITITSATELSQEIKLSLESKLNSKYGDGHNFVYKTNKSLLLGLVIQLGDTEYHYDLQDQIEFILLELLK